jgi:hypothetical protein
MRRQEHAERVGQQQQEGHDCSRMDLVKMVQVAEAVERAENVERAKKVMVMEMSGQRWNVTACRRHCQVWGSIAPPTAYLPVGS